MNAVKPGTQRRGGRPARIGVVLLGVVGLVIAGCGNDAETATPAQQGDVQDGREAETANAVLIKGFIFKPSPLEVKAGTQVTWTNEDQILHTVTAGAPGQLTGAFDQEMPGRGAVFNFTFNDPGTYQYFCQRHNSMTGTVTVS
ncbi:MAG: plastocyanin/azurin family copper-binding protein [Acidimicrobiia bacterium]